MADLDALLRSSLQQHAEDGPRAHRLLAAVHDRSDQLRRRRRRWTRSLTLAAAVVLTAAVPATATLISPQAQTQAQTQSHPQTQSPAPTQSVGATAASSTPDTGLRLAPPSYQVPTLRLRPDPAGAIPRGGLKTPVVSLDGGALSGFFEAKDGVRGADITLVVTARKPTFGADGGMVVERTTQVRGRSGTLRVVSVAPAAHLTLYWQEGPDQWIQLRSDDTLSDDDMVAVANGLVSADLPVDVGLRLDLAPAGLVLDSASLSRLVLRPSDAPAGAPPSSAIVCALYKSHALTGQAVTVGRYRATVSRNANGVQMAVNVDDQGLTLLIDIPARYPISDADLLRFAAGVHVTDRAEPQGA